MLASTFKEDNMLSRTSSGAFPSAVFANKFLEQASCTPPRSNSKTYRFSPW